MGKTLDALLGRAFKSSKLKTLVKLTISRLSVLKNQRQSRCSQARSDVTELLKNGEHERALVRVEKVIKEQNLLDLLIMIEGYCNLLTERICLLEQDRLCPHELEEAVASLIYAASRCSDLPELQDIRRIFASRYGKEFAARAVELRNNCGVNPKVMEKLSTKFPSLEMRMKIVKEIASHNNIVLQLKEASSASEQERFNQRQNQCQPKTESSANSGSSDIGDDRGIPEDMKSNKGLSHSRQTRTYRDVAEAAQEAFESAAYAAVAAKAALDLSQTRPPDPGYRGSPGNSQGQVSFDWESESNRNYSEHQDKEFKESMGSIELGEPTSSPSSHVADIPFNARGQKKVLQEEIIFEESDNKTRIKQSRIWIPGTSSLDSDMKSAKITNDLMHRRVRSSVEGKEPQVQSPHNVGMEKWSHSVRTRHIQGY